MQLLGHLITRARRLWSLHLQHNYHLCTTHSCVVHCGPALPWMQDELIPLISVDLVYQIRRLIFLNSVLHFCVRPYFSLVYLMYRKHEGERHSCWRLECLKKKGGSVYYPAQCWLKFWWTFFISQSVIVFAGNSRVDFPQNAEKVESGDFNIAHQKSMMQKKKKIEEETTDGPTSAAFTMSQSDGA